MSETHARLARTRHTLVDLICYGFDSTAGSAAIQRLLDVPQDLKVSPEDYQYVLATFFLEPLRWSEQHGLKAVTQGEANLLLRFWMQVGHAMSIPNPLMCLRDIVKLSLPRGTQGIFRQIMIATIEPAVRQSLGIAAPHWSARPPVRILLDIMTCEFSGRTGSPCAKLLNRCRDNIE